MTSINTTAVPALVNLDESRITRGQLAWSRIKATAAEQRELWRQVGEALLVGKEQNPSNQGFGKWCDEYGFGVDDGMGASLRSDVMWMTYNWGLLSMALKEASCRISKMALTNPRDIRTWFRDYIREADLPESLQDLPIEAKPSVTLDQRSAEKLAKVINRAQSGDEGSETAKRHVESIAKKHGVSSEVLKEVVAETAPEAFYQFSMQQLELLTEIEENVLATVIEMEAAGCTREAIASVFIKIGNKIKGEA